MSDQECLMNLLKKEMRSILMPSKEGLTLAELSKEYRLMIGKQLPFRALGYNSAMEMVKDMPDVVNICPARNGDIVLKAIADESTKGIASLVARQKNSAKSYLSKQKPHYNFHSRSFPGQSRNQISLPLRGKVPPPLPAVIKSELKELLSSSPVLLSDFEKSFIRRFGRTFEFIRYGFFSMSEVLNAASDIITVVQTRAGSLLTLKESCNHNPPGKMQKSVAETLTPGLPINNQSLTPRVASDTLVLQTKSEEKSLESSVNRMKQLEKEMEIVLTKKRPGGIISLELKERIKTVVAEHSEGLLLSKLPAEFEMHFKEILPIGKLGFPNLVELVAALDDVLHIEYKEKEKDWLIFDMDSWDLRSGDHADNGSVQSEFMSCEEPPHTCGLPSWDSPSMDSNILEKKENVIAKVSALHLNMEELYTIQEAIEDEIPPDVVHDRNLYSLPELSSGTLVGVSVEQIVSPSQFYVRICSTETSRKLEDMMIEMRRLYSNKNIADRYIIPEALLRPGHLCCVKNLVDTWWYRVIIHQILNDQEVEVFYPDFGNMRTVQKSSLRLLKSCYTKLPAQAIPCSLAWVKPTQHNWTVNAKIQFQQFCRQKVLVGVVDEYIDGVLYLFLCDTSSDEDVYLHNILRLEGHALICRENIPCKAFRELNPFNLYIKPSPKEQNVLSEELSCLPQEEYLDNVPEATSLDSSRTEMLFRSCNGNDEEREDLEGLKPAYLEHNQLADSSHYPCDFLGNGALQNPHENSSLDQREQPPHIKNGNTRYSDAEMPYLEPVNFHTEIWDENDIFSNRCEEEMNYSCSTLSLIQNEEKEEKAKDDFVLMGEKGTSCEVGGAVRAYNSCITKNMDTFNLVKTSPAGEPQSKILASSGTLEAINPLGTSPNSLAETLEEFYISVVHSMQPAMPRQLDLNLSELSACSSQLVPFASVLHENSEKKVNDICRNQIITLHTAQNFPSHGVIGHNALVFTAKLQGSSTFSVPCNPASALGASACLASCARYFSFNLRNKNP